MFRVSTDRSSMPEPTAGAVLGPLGEAVMRVLWDAGATRTGRIVERLRQPDGSGPAYSTVTTILGRLHERGLVERTRHGREATYRAAVSEHELVATGSSRAVDAVLARYGTSAMRHFAERLADLDPELRKRLLSLAEEHDRPRREDG